MINVRKEYATGLLNIAKDKKAKEVNTNCIRFEPQPDNKLAIVATDTFRLMVLYVENPGNITEPVNLTCEAFKNRMAIKDHLVLEAIRPDELAGEFYPNWQHPIPTSEGIPAMCVREDVVHFYCPCSVNMKQLQDLCKVFNYGLFNKHEAGAGHALMYKHEELIYIQMMHDLSKDDEACIEAAMNAMEAAVA